MSGIDLSELILKSFDEVLKSEKQDKFYLVSDGVNKSSVPHCYRDEAIAEAKRLAKKEGKKFYVLETIKSFEINNLIEKDL